MGKAKLDRSRSFGEIIGLVSDGVRYQQDGKDFDGQGNEIKNDAPVPVVAAPAEAIAVVAPKPVKKTRRKRRTKAQMAAARETKAAGSTAAPTATPPSTPPGVGLSTEVFK